MSEGRASSLACSAALGLVELPTRLLGSNLTILAPPELAAQIEHELRPLWRPDPAAVTAPVLVVLDRDDEKVGVQLALTEITRAAIAASPLLCVHAGVVAARGGTGTIAFPGLSGRGKTTLVAALVQRGFDYISDEVLGIDRVSAEIASFARPLALDRNSWELLALDQARLPEPGEEQLAGPSELGHCATVIPALRDIVLFERERDSGHGVTIDPLNRGQAVHALLDNAFNHFADPAASFHQIVGLVRATRVWRLRYSDARDAADTLAERWGRPD